MLQHMTPGTRRALAFTVPAFLAVLLCKCAVGPGTLPPQAMRPPAPGPGLQVVDWARDNHPIVIEDPNKSKASTSVRTSTRINSKGEISTTYSTNRRAQ